MNVNLIKTTIRFSDTSHNPKQVLCLLVVSIFMTSCATIMNQPHKNVEVHTTEPSRIVYRHDTIKTVNNKANLWLERKKETPSIVTMTDSIAKSIEIKPRNSFMYWANIYFNWGVGMLVDMNNPKRYTYPSRIYINSADTISKYFRYNPDNKGELHLHLSLPHFNFFCLVPESEGVSINTSFWGLTIGLDYYHSQNQFINLGASYAFGFVFPIPASVRLIGEIESGSSRYISLSNNHRIRRFAIGYGLSYGRNTWDYRYFEPEDHFLGASESVTKSHDVFGFIFPTYFQIGERFNMGVVYRPTFYRPILTKKFAYEHLISIDFAWKIRLMKSSQQRQ